MSKIKLKPIGPRVLVKEHEADSVTDSGIIIPEVAKGKAQIKEGVVSAVGNACTDVAVGDEILFGAYSGTELIVEKETYIMIPEQDVLAIV